MDGDACIIHQVAARKRLTREPERDDMILENDTESRRTRTAIFTSHGLIETVNSRMSFELEGKPRDSIQDLTQEFDPGSGRTLAACLTHASRAGRRKLASES